MSLGRTHSTLITIWVVAVLLFIGVSLANGTPITLAWSVGVLALGCLPPAILLTIFRGAPPRTIGQVLYDEEHATVAAQDVPASTRARD
jgi:hypothetical protein